MNTLMTVNGLDTVSICYVAPENTKFNCHYALGGKLQQYAYHIKCGFNSFAEAIQWYLTMYPNGNVLTQQNFLELQHTLLQTKISAQDMSQFDPLRMEGLNTTKQPIRNKDGSLNSQFE